MSGVGLFCAISTPGLDEALALGGPCWLGLCVQARSRAAEQTCKRSGEGEGICGTVLHK